MEKSRVTLLVAVSFVIGLVALYVLTRDSVRPDSEFQAYESDEDSTIVGDAGVAVPSVTAMNRAGDEEDDAPRPVPKPSEPADDAPVRDSEEPSTDRDPSPYPAVDGTEDTLNRPGPPPDEIERPPGNLDKETIQDGIKAVTPLVKVCYEETLKDFPDAAGKVTVGFRIIGEEGEGRVEMSELDPERTTLFDEKLHDCMLKSVGEATFEAPEGGGVVNVRYPFKFDTDSDSDQPE